LWVGGLSDDIAEPQIRAAFFPFGELSSIRVIAEKKCAFVTFMRRTSAEAAANKLYNSLNISGKNLRLAWGKRQTTRGSGGGGGVSAPPGVKGGSSGGALPPGIRAAPVYPSQNPQNQAARFSTPVD